MRRFLALIVLGLVAAVLLAPAAQAAFGIDPGKVYIENLYPGAEADIPITLYNQNDYEATFIIKAREPDYTDTGYETFPHLDWITITPDQVTISAKGQSDVLIVIIMPEDADYSSKKAEVWISFMEQETEGMIKIEICSRLFISTRIETEIEPPAVQGEGAVGITAEAGGEKPVSPPLIKPETEAPSETPTVHDNGSVGITPEAGVEEPVSHGSPWAIIGSMLGAILVGGAIFFLMRRRRHV